MFAIVLPRYEDHAVFGKRKKYNKYARDAKLRVVKFSTREDAIVYADLKGLEDYQIGVSPQ